MLMKTLNHLLPGLDSAVMVGREIMHGHGQPATHMTRPIHTPVTSWLRKQLHVNLQTRSPR